jgi:chromosome segregation ATPase
MSTLEEMREKHREMRERIAQNPTPVSLLQEHNQKMSDMKMQMNQDMENLRRGSQQVSANLRTVMKQDAAALREDQQETIQKVIAELTSAHESARKAENDSHRWDLVALNKKIEVSKETTALLETQVNSLKSELKTVAMKDKKAAASASELKHLRDQFGVQQRKLDRKTSEMEECKRELAAKTADYDDLEIQVSEFAEQTRLAKCSVQASKEETKSKQDEIEALHDTVHGLRQGLDQKQSEIEAGQRTTAEANARADASDDQVRKLTAQLKESEEKRKCLILELESVQMALDEANARAARAEKLAKQTQRLLKEEIDAAEEGKQRQRVEIEARFQAMMEASEQKRRTQQSLLEVRKKEVANANARAKKFADYAKKVQNSLKTALSEKSEEAAREAAIAGSEFFFHHFD